MVYQLGARLDPFDLQPFFIEQSTDHKIHIILDPSHCIKLVRNNFASRSILYDTDNNEIKWEFLVKLMNFGNKCDFNLSHKLTRRHIQYQDRIMHVRTAVETLSKSVADSMQFLMDQNIEEFQHAGATIRFIRMFDNLFDVMNTQRIMNSHPNKFKSALNFNNQDELFSFLREAKDYILSLKVKDANKLIPIVKSNVKAGFRGLAMNAQSISAMYETYVGERQDMSMLATYRLSQDHLEMFFNRIRSRNGCNDNPTVIQFQSSYKRIQLISDLNITIGANVSAIAASNILTISSSKKNEKKRVPHENNEDEEEEEDSNTINIENIQHADYLIDKCNNGAITFVAYTIEQTILNCEQFYCELCRKVLLENGKLIQRDCIGGKVPCKSTFDICKAADIAIKQYVGSTQKHLTNRVISSVLMNLNIDHIFSRYFYPEHDRKHAFYYT